MSTAVDRFAASLAVSTRPDWGGRPVPESAPIDYFAARIRPVAQGMTIFPDVRSALNAGFQIEDPHYEITPGVYGMLVRTMTAAGWVRAIALVPRRDDAA